MTASRRMVISNLLFVAVVAVIVAAILYRTDPGRIVQTATKPYMTMLIQPDSLHQHQIDDTTQWGLFYTLETLKQNTCHEVLVERFLHRIGEPFPLASNRDISGEIVAPGDTERLTHGLHVRIPHALAPGDYFLLLRSTCYVTDDEGVKTALAPPAEAFVCFRVPPITDRSEEMQRLQPVSDNCRRELSSAVVRSWPYRLANGR